MHTAICAFRSPPRSDSLRQARSTIDRRRGLLKPPGFPSLALPSGALSSLALPSFRFEESSSIADSTLCKTETWGANLTSLKLGRSVEDLISIRFRVKLDESISTRLFGERDPLSVGIRVADDVPVAEVREVREAREVREVRHEVRHE